MEWTLASLADAYRRGAAPPTRNDGIPLADIANSVRAMMSRLPPQPPASPMPTRGEVIETLNDFTTPLKDRIRNNPEYNPGPMDFAMALMGGRMPLPRTAGIRAYHGSPHDFDRFDLSKIGTGEGAQAYGHGLYFAEAEPVARAYRDTLAPSRGKLPDDVIAMSADPRRAFMTHAMSDADPLTAAKRAQYMSGPLREENLTKLADLVEQTRLARQGRMYEVNINAKPEQFLDWDKPLAMDHAARQRLLELGEKGMAQHGFGIDRQFAKDSINAARNENLTGEGAYRVMGKAVDQARPILKAEGDPRALFGDLGAMSSQQFQQAGIPGIRYLDQGSRGTGTGTSNYVVFDDSLIDILRKYGLAGVPAAGVAGAALSDQRTQ